MTYKAICTMTVLAALMAAPLSANAQDRNRDSGRGSESHRSSSDRGRSESNRSQSERRRSSSDNWSSSRDRVEPTRSNRVERDSGRNWSDSRSFDNRRSDDRRFEDRSSRDRIVTHSDRDVRVDRNWERDRFRDDHFARPFVFSREHSDWNDLILGFGFIGLVGALEHDDCLVFVGGAGALYSLWRYDEDRDCDDPYRRARAEFFSVPYFYRDGCRFERRIVVRGGDRFYQFVRR